MTLQTVRNTRMWVSTAKSGFTKSNTIEVLPLEDFSFSQDSNTTVVTPNEAGPIPTRGSRRFNDSLNPADWSFSTYLRPYLDYGADGTSSGSDNVQLMPDYYLWHSLASGSPVDITNNKGVQANDVNMLVKFTDNSVHVLNELTIFYLVDKEWFKVDGVQVGNAEVSVDIEGIGTTAWSGQGLNVNPLTTQPFDPDSDDFKMSDDIFNRAGYIVNKLSILRLTDNEDSDKVYDIPLTGGSVTIANNITYLTPNTLSRLDKPIGSFTGAFEVTASVEAYFSAKGSKNPNDMSAELFKKILADSGIDNSFKVSFVLGGESDAGAPAVVFVLPKAHATVPTIGTGDFLTTAIEFKGIPTELNSGDEMYMGCSSNYTTAQITKLISTGDGK